MYKCLGQTGWRASTNRNSPLTAPHCAYCIRLTRSCSSLYNSAPPPPPMMESMVMMKAAVIYEPGGPEVLKLETIPVPKPKDDEVLIRVKAFGLNRSELFTRQGHSLG